jgi:hypothetical protein
MGSELLDLARFQPPWPRKVSWLPLICESLFPRANAFLEGPALGAGAIALMIAVTIVAVGAIILGGENHTGAWTDEVLCVDGQYTFKGIALSDIVPDLTPVKIANLLGEPTTVCKKNLAKVLDAYVKCASPYTERLHWLYAGEAVACRPEAKALWDNWVATHNVAGVNAPPLAATDR